MDSAGPSRLKVNQRRSNRQSQASLPQQRTDGEMGTESYVFSSDTKNSSPPTGKPNLQNPTKRQSDIPPPPMLVEMKIQEFDTAGSKITKPPPPPSLVSKKTMHPGIGAPPTLIEFKKDSISSQRNTDYMRAHTVAP